MRLLTILSSCMLPSALLAALCMTSAPSLAANVPLQSPEGNIPRHADSVMAGSQREELSMASSSPMLAQLEPGSSAGSPVAGSAGTASDTSPARQLL